MEILKLIFLQIFFSIQTFWTTCTKVRIKEHYFSHSWRLWMPLWLRYNKCAELQNLFLFFFISTKYNKRKKFPSPCHKHKVFFVKLVISTLLWINGSYGSILTFKIEFFMLSIVYQIFILLPPWIMSDWKKFILNSRTIQWSNLCKSWTNIDRKAKEGRILFDLFRKST